MVIVNQWMLGVYVLVDWLAAYLDMHLATTKDAFTLLSSLASGCLAW